MVTKMTVKNQLTIPKKILERAGLAALKDDERYFDLEVKDNVIVLKPVRLIVEDRIPEKQWKRFEDWAGKVEKHDKVFSSAKKALGFLRKRAGKK